MNIHMQRQTTGMPYLLKDKQCIQQNGQKTLGNWRITVETYFMQYYTTFDRGCLLLKWKLIYFLICWPWFNFQKSFVFSIDQAKSNGEVLTNIGMDQFTPDLPDTVNSAWRNSYVMFCRLIARSKIKSNDGWRVSFHQLYTCVLLAYDNAKITELIGFKLKMNLQRLKWYDIGINIAGVYVKPLSMDSVCNLSVYVDSRLDMQTHIGSIVLKCLFRLCRLLHLRHTASTEIRQLLVSALVLSRFDNCNKGYDKRYKGLHGAITMALLLRDRLTWAVTDIRNYAWWNIWAKRRHIASVNYPKTPVGCIRFVHTSDLQPWAGH